MRKRYPDDIPIHPAPVAHLQGEALKLIHGEILDAEADDLMLPPGLPLQGIS